MEMPESEEKEFASFSLFSPSRAPLNSIPDPSQLRKKATHLSDFELAQKFEGRGGAAHDSNPRIVPRNARSRSEQSTPNRNGARVSLGGGCVSQSMADSVGTTPHFEQVLMKLRPLSTMERASQGHGRCLKQESPQQTLLWLGHPETRLTFDHVASETISQAETMSSIGENKEVCFSESKNCCSVNCDTDDPDGNRVQIINESLDVLEENDGSMKLLNNKSSMEREAVPRIEGHEVVREQVETETARTILELQEEMIALESEFQGRFCKLTEENPSMKDAITAREAELRALNQDWDMATLEPTNLIVDGSKSTQIESIVCSFPQVKRRNPATKMTSRLPFFFSLFLYTITTLTPTALGATSCRTSCGSIQINYPFGIDKGCGSPQFNGMLNCSSTDLFFFTPSGGYKVRSIDYDKNKMVVFDPLMSTCSILQPHHDFKLSDIQNALIRPSYDTVFALFNCTNVSPVQNRYKSLCFNAAGHSCDELYSSCTSFRIFNTTSPYGNSTGLGNSTVHTTPYCCFTSYDTVRVMSMNILDCSHYTTVIDDGKMRGVVPIDWSYGIELSYSAPEIGCSPCRKSGGTCGYDDETDIFLCQCSNNISPRDCGGGSDQGGCNSTKVNYPMFFLVMLVSVICAIL